MAKLKFNILDFIIIVAVIAVLGVGAYLFTRVNKTEVSKGTPATVEFMVEVKDLTETQIDAFKNAVGNEIVFGTKNSDYGIITDVVVEPYKRCAKDLVNGKIYWDTFPNKFQAIVTIKANIYENQQYFVGNNEEVRVGMKMPFSGGGIASPEGIIVKLNKLEGGLK